MTTVSDEENPLLLKKPKQSYNYQNLDGVLVREKNPLIQMKEKYDDAKVAPYIRFRDMNAAREGEPESSARPSVEIGIRFRF